VAVRLIALYNQPQDPTAFDAHYREVHAPIVRRYPGLRELRLTSPISMGSRHPRFHLMAEMFFDSRADLDAAMTSDAGVESGRDLATFAQAGVVLFIAEDGVTDA
jgi:uncharacterized protein (TIGR02118 family)